MESFNGLEVVVVNAFERKIIVNSPYNHVTRQFPSLSLSLLLMRCCLLAESPKLDDDKQPKSKKHFLGVQKCPLLARFANAQKIELYEKEEGEELRGSKSQC